MTKPDWAERLQRSRQRQYEKGWADCEARIIKLLEEMFDEWVDIRRETLIAFIQEDNK